MGLSLPLEPIHKAQSTGWLIVEILGYAGRALTIIPMHVLVRDTECISKTYESSHTPHASLYNTGIAGNNSKLIRLS